MRRNIRSFVQIAQRHMDSAQRKARAMASPPT
jgi:hypothetical protein